MALQLAGFINTIVHNALNFRLVPIKNTTIYGCKHASFSSLLITHARTYVSGPKSHLKWMKKCVKKFRKKIFRVQVTWFDFVRIDQSDPEAWCVDIFFWAAELYPLSNKWKRFHVCLLEYLYYIQATIFVCIAIISDLYFVCFCFHLACTMFMYTNKIHKVICNLYTILEEI